MIDLWVIVIWKTSNFLAFYFSFLSFIDTKSEIKRIRDWKVENEEYNDWTISVSQIIYCMKFPRSGDWLIKNLNLVSNYLGFIGVQGRSWTEGNGFSSPNYLLHVIFSIQGILIRKVLICEIEIRKKITFVVRFSLVYMYLRFIGTSREKIRVEKCEYSQKGSFMSLFIRKCRSGANTIQFIYIILLFQN